MPKKVNFQARYPLRRSVSTTSIGLLFATQLKLRDTKSCTEGIEDAAKSDSSDENDVLADRLGDLAIQKKHYTLSNDTIETRDLHTNEIVIVKLEDLQHGGKQYNSNQIARYWKKDYRIWLWKNSKEFKRKRLAGGEKGKQGFGKPDKFAAV